MANNKRLHSTLKAADFETVHNGKKTGLYYLSNKLGTEIAVTNFGARVVELWVADRNGKFADVVLGHDNIDAYINYSGERFLGAAIGRFGNRIAHGKFSLGGKEYSLPLNDGANSLHGGYKGFDMVVWDVTQPDGQTLEFTYLSPDMEEGFPGSLQVDMTYMLSDDNEFIIRYRAQTDKATVVNLTHHSFFNLHGAGAGSINDHELMINARSYTPVDETLIPTGKMASVELTPMDFLTPTAIGARVDEPFAQLEFGHGYDHNWMLDKKCDTVPELAATLYEPTSGRYLEVFTTQPGMQFYGGNFFDGSTVGKGGTPYRFRESLALETQHFPDSPNNPAFPSTTLEAGEVYEHQCIYKFNLK